MLLNNIISKRLIIRGMLQDNIKDIWQIWSAKENDLSNGFLKVITLKNNNEIIGTCCFGPTNKKDEWGFGYSIKQKY